MSISSASVGTISMWLMGAKLERCLRDKGWSRRGPEPGLFYKNICRVTPSLHYPHGKCELVSLTMDTGGYSEPIRHIWAVLMQNFEQKCSGSFDQSDTLHILLPSSGKNLNCSRAGIIQCGLSLAIQRYKILKKSCFFLRIIFYQIYCVIFFYIQFTFPQTSKCFFSNGIKNMHILASGLELQAVRFGCHFRRKLKKRGGSLRDFKVQKGK